MQDDQFLDSALQLGALFCLVVRDVSASTMRNAVDASEAAAKLSDSSSTAADGLAMTELGRGSQELGLTNDAGASRCMANLADLITTHSRGRDGEGMSDALLSGMPQARCIGRDAIWWCMKCVMLITAVLCYCKRGIVSSC